MASDQNGHRLDSGARTPAILDGGDKTEMP